MTSMHKTHKDAILGRYCWVCKVKTESGVPGWPMAHQGPSVAYSPWAYNQITGEGYATAVVWANGDLDSKREGSSCSMCDKNCKYPVNRAVTETGDSYREIRKSEVKAS